MADSSNIPGKWQLSSSDNFDAFMSALGIGYVTRKLGNASKPLVTVTHEGDKQYSFKQESLLKVRQTHFTHSLIQFIINVNVCRRLKSSSS